LLKVIFEEEYLLLAVFVVAISRRSLVWHPDDEIDVFLDALISTMANLCSIDGIVGLALLLR